VRFAWIEEHRATWPVAVQCEVLDVSRSGFYAWRERPLSGQSQRRELLLEEIQAIHHESRKDV
jgi:putative transposase